ncbi:MAG: hypothetical protein WAS21_06475 [Geminicoccaceae bacterium]
MDGAAGLTTAPQADATEIEPDEAFWCSARIVDTAAPRKTPVHLRIDPETFAFFRAGAKGRPTSMAKVLEADAQSHGKTSELVER